MTINIPQANAPVDRVHQVILNTLVTKDLDNKVFYHTNTWGETLASIAIDGNYPFSVTAASGVITITPFGG